MPRNEDDQKFQIEAVTSDITYMKETYCIAGWNPSGQHMKRLFIKGKHCEDSDLKKIGKYARLLVNVIPAERSRDSRDNKESAINCIFAKRDLIFKIYCEHKTIRPFLEFWRNPKGMRELFFIF